MTAITFEEVEGLIALGLIWVGLDFPGLRPLLNKMNEWPILAFWVSFWLCYVYLLLHVDVQCST